MNTETLNKIPESNTEWAAQQLLLNLTSKQLSQMKYQIKKLDQILYKSWAKDLPLSEILSAFRMTEKEVTP